MEKYPPHPKHSPIAPLPPDTNISQALQLFQAPEESLLDLGSLLDRQTLFLGLSPMGRQQGR